MKRAYLSVTAFSAHKDLTVRTDLSTSPATAAAAELLSLTVFDLD